LHIWYIRDNRKNGAVGASGTDIGNRKDASGAVGALKTAVSVVAGSAVFVLLARTTAVRLENRGLSGGLSR
jgi:hypothetical protein